MNIHHAARMHPHAQVAANQIPVGQIPADQVPEHAAAPDRRPEAPAAIDWPHWQLLHGVLEGTPEFIAAFDADRRFLILNSALQDEFQTLYGVSVTVGTHLAQVLDPLPDERDQVVGLIDHALSGQTFHGMVLLGDSGHARHSYELNVFPILDTDGAVIAAAFIGRNVSAEQKAEAALRDLNERLEQRVHERSAALKASEESLRLATEGAQVGIWYIDLVTGRQEWSPLCGALFGMTDVPLPLEAAQLLDRIDPSDRRTAQDTVERAIADGAAFEIEFRIRYPDGTVRWLQARGQVEVRDHHPARLAGVLLDIHDRKQAIEAVSQSERQWRELAEVMPQVVWSADPSGRIQYVNQRWHTMTGLSPGQEASWPDVLHPDDRDRALRAWAQATTSGDPYQIEYRFRTRDSGDAYRWFLARALPIRNAQGDITCWYGTCTDIHEQKIGQVALARANDRWQQALAQLDSLLEHAPLGFAFFDRACRYMRVNAHLARLNGLLPEAHIGHLVREVMPNIAPLVENLIHEVFRTGRTIHHEIAVAIPTEPGVLRTWDCIFYPVRTRYDAASWVGLVATDITTRKQVEAALAASESRFRGVFENAAVGLAQISPDGRWNRVNRRLCEILDYSAEELHTLTFADVTHPDDRAADRDQYHKLKAGLIPSYQMTRVTSFFWVQSCVK